MKIGPDAKSKYMRAPELLNELLDAIYEIKEKYQTLEMYIFNELGFNENDIKKLIKLYSN